MSNTNRRNFLKQLGSLGLVASAPMAFPNLILSNDNRKLGIALVGLGIYSTRILAPALQQTEHCELKGIITGTPSKIPQWQENYGIKDGNIYDYENMHTIADNPEIDVVYIVLPNSMHMEYSAIAANAGKHVWCEKPMAMDVDECQQIIDACDKNKVRLAIGYRMQHEPNTQKIIQFGEEQRYGSIEQVKAVAGFRYQQGWSTNDWKVKKAYGGGAMYDMGVYPINATRYTTRENPVSVTARIETERDLMREVDENVWFDLTFPSGVVASCQTSFGNAMNELRVDCTDGWYRLSPFMTYDGIRGDTSDGRTFTDQIPNQQVQQMDNDSLAIKNNTEVIAPGMDGLEDIRIVEAIFKAAETGDEVNI